MQRLSLLDAEFLDLEDGVAHMHIAGVSMFEPPVPPVDDLLGLLRAKIHLIPRYRQRIRTVPLELGRPVWVDDPHFNLEYHVRHTALPAPGDDDALRRLMGRLMSQPLDRNRPLWECWLVEGFADGGWALVSKIHHCMVDGISGVDLLNLLLDIDRSVDLPQPEPWLPEAEPTGPALVLDAWGGLAQDLGGLARRVPGWVRDPVGTARTAGTLGGGLVTFAQKLGTVPPLSIEGGIGPHRAWAHSSTTIDAIRTVRSAFGGTLNDVVLTAVTGGYRALLEHRGDDIGQAVLRTLVPVSVRGADAHGVFDNRVSAMLYELPVQVDDPRRRLEAIHTELVALKGSHMAEAGEVVTSLGNIAPPMVVGSVSRMASRLMRQLPQRSVSTVTTNVPGPQFPLYCLGREMTAYYPYVPISHGVRVGTAILSYNGGVAFGVTGDFDTVPEIGILADAIADSMDELVALAEADRAVAADRR